MRIYDFLEKSKAPFEILQHAPAFSAQKLAKYLHLPGKVIVKSVLLKTPTHFFTCLLQADQRLDWDKLGHCSNEKIRFAKGEEIQDLFPDCEWGVVSCFGSLYGLEVFLEESLLTLSNWVMAGHSHLEAIKIGAEDFIRLEKPARLQLISEIKTPA